MHIYQLDYFIFVTEFSYIILHFICAKLKSLLVSHELLWIQLKATEYHICSFYPQLHGNLAEGRVKVGCGQIIIFVSFTPSS